MLNLRLDHSGVDISATLTSLSDYTAHLQAVRSSGGYEALEASLNLPFDDQLLERVKALASEKVSPQLKYTVVVGIGGSNLGTKAVYDALLGYHDLLEPSRFPKMLFAETTDPEVLASLNSLLATLTQPEELLLVVISKSGGTTETLANFEILTAPLRDRFGSAATDRVVTITDDGSKFMQAAEAAGIAHLGMPAKVGGRYSVLAAVGLFPLLSVGLNVDQLRHGARSLMDSCLSGDNIAAKSAAALALNQADGRTINDNFFFHPELESLGKWYRQLMGESVGKQRNLDDQIVYAGITPTVSLGSTDLHSVGQLYLGGPKDKFSTFISSTKSVDITVPAGRTFPDLVPMISGKSAAAIMTAILDGTKIAYQKAGRPFMEITLDALDEQSIGAFLQFKMLEMMYLGRLLNVNSFDQPSVESYKIETKRLLQA
jgi:glucose-6-phosphate isomerase